MSVASSKRLENLTVSLFQSLRVEEPFGSFYKVALGKMKELPFISEQRKLSRKHCAPDYSEADLGLLQHSRWSAL